MNQNNIESITITTINTNDYLNNNIVTNSLSNTTETVKTEIYELPDPTNQFTLNGVSQVSLGLNSPTQIVKYNNMYFIVNTFSNSILSSTDMKNWNEIEPPKDLNFNLAHSVAFDGKNLIVTDTDNKRMLSYEYINGKFIYKNSFTDNGLNPRFHYVIYNKNNDTYYAIASEFGDNTKTYEFKIKDGEFISPNGEKLVGKDITDNRNNYITNNNSYVRSFTIENNSIIMPIHNTDKSSEILIMDNHFNIQQKIKVPDSIGGVTCIKKVNDYYVLTSSTDKSGSIYPNISIAKNLTDFENGNFKIVDMSNYITSNNQTPYFIENIDGNN